MLIFIDNYMQKKMRAWIGLHVQLLVADAFSLILSFVQQTGTVDPHY